MRTKCCQCGVEDDHKWMYELNTGRSKKWLCHECWKQAQSEVLGSEMRSQKRLRKVLDK